MIAGTMAKTRATSNRKPRMSEQQMDTGGGNPLKGWIASGRKVVTRSVNEAARDVGRWVAPTPNAPTMPKSGGGLKSVRGEVYTPSGVYQGRQVFVRKPALTENQIEGILRAQQTKAMKQFSRDVGVGARGAKLGAAAGALGGSAVTLGAQNIASSVKSVVSAAKKRSARGGGKNKK
jgi:hypothetical protein